MPLTQPGDSVTGLFYEDRPGDPTSDTFGKYALQKTSLSMPVRDSVSHTEAATLPVRVKSIHILLNSTVEGELQTVESLSWLRSLVVIC
jgi:NADPH:quinone reductase-like Zn-dependent oxidoreductase